MQAEGPVGNFSRPTHYFRVLFRDLDGVGLTSSKEVKVKDSAKDIVFQSGTTFACFIQLDVHPIGIEKEHAVGTSCSMFEVDWMVAV